MTHKESSENQEWVFSILTQFKLSIIDYMSALIKNKYELN